MVNKLEDTLKGGFKGLYGEVVQHDCYKLKQLKFVPDIFFDLGANVGVTTRYAMELFPNAFIISVEPDKENFQHLIHFTEKRPNWIPLNMAIGYGQMFRVSNAVNGAHESYINDEIAAQHLFENWKNIQRVEIENRMIDSLMNTFLAPSMKSVLKLDVEMAEEIIWEHEPSMEALKKIDYFTGEIHYTMLTGKASEISKEKSLKALNSFSDTHDVIIQGTSFWCTKK